MKKQTRQFVCTTAMAVVMSGSMVMHSYASVPALTVGPDVQTIETIDENGGKVITWIFPPTPMEWPSEADTWERIPPLTKAPEVGVTLGNILKDVNDTTTTGASRFTDCYWSYSMGQCTWYARGRFKEVFGIEMPSGMCGIKTWMETAYLSDEIKTITDINDIREQSIAVYIPEPEDENQPGHVVFIEYVERDEEGKPLTIYYTETNGIYDLNKGEFDNGYDGTVRKKSFEQFKSPYKLKLTGYIIAAK